MNFRIWSARGAMGFAPLVVAQVVARNWGDWEWWPFWIDDLAAAVLLLVGGYLALESLTTTNSRVLTAGWFFSLATLWASLFRMLFQSPADAPTSGWLLALMVVSVVSSLAGAAASLPSNRPAAPARKPSSKAATRSKGQAD